MDSCGVDAGAGVDVGRNPEINWLRTPFNETGDATESAMDNFKSARQGFTKPVEERIVAKAPRGAMAVGAI